MPAMLWTLIPAKSFSQSKRRLTELLGEADCARLSAALLSHTVRVARQALVERPVIVVTPDREVAGVAIAAGADRAIMVTSSGLNAQLSEAAQQIPAEDDLLVVHGDLPLLHSGDILATIATQGPVVIAPDHAGTGTNALLQRTPTRQFAFGPGSCTQHDTWARERGLTPAYVYREGLARDLDDPADFERLGLSLEDLLKRLVQHDRHETSSPI